MPANSTARGSFALGLRTALAMSPQCCPKIVAELRMRLASHRIGANKMPVEAVANALGYASQAAFGRAYKRVTGHPGAVQLQADATRRAP